MPEKHKPAEPDGAATPAELLTPEQWARRKDLFVQAKFAGQDSHFHWTHAAAAALHGWAAHAHHAGEPIRLSEADYDAALAAVQGEGNPKAHRAAMSPHCGHDGGHPKGIR